MFPCTACICWADLVAGSGSASLSVVEAGFLHSAQEFPASSRAKKSLQWGTARGPLVWKYNNILLMCYTIMGCKRDLQKHLILLTLDAALILAWSTIHSTYTFLSSSNGKNILRHVIAGRFCVSTLSQLCWETVCFSHLGAQQDTLVYIYPTLLDILLKPWASLCNFRIVAQIVVTVNLEWPLTWNVYLFGYCWFDIFTLLPPSTSCFIHQIFLTDTLMC